MPSQAQDPSPASTNGRPPEVDESPRGVRRWLEDHEKLLGALAGALTVTVLVVGFVADVAGPLFWGFLIGVAVVALAAAVVILRGQLLEAKEQLRTTEGALRMGGEVVTASGKKQVTRAKGGKRIMGIDLGRDWLTVGILGFDDEDPEALPQRTHFQRRFLKVRSPLGELEKRVIGLDDLYDTIVAAIVAATRNWEGPLDGIGIGLPGQIDPASGLVLDYPPAFAPNEPFRDHLMQRIDENDGCKTLPVQGDPKVRKLPDFGTEEIFLDNDVRCATRRILSRRLGEAGWQNFACVHVGGGVGSGLVLNNRLMYGSDRTAGEVGHVIVHLAPHQAGPPQQADPPHNAGPPPEDDGAGSAILAYPGLAHTPSWCACGRWGVHWEALTKGAALESLALQTDDGIAGEIARAFGDEDVVEGEFARQLTLAARFRWSDSWRAAVEDDRRRTAVEEAMRFRTGTHTDVDLQRVVDSLYRLVKASDKRVADYIEAVLGVYARYFAVGVANLVNLLNLNHVVLGGGVMDSVWPIPWFRNRVETALRSYELEAAHQNGLFIHDPMARPGWAWEGAALLFQDPGYEAVRTGFDARPERRVFSVPHAHVLA